MNILASGESLATNQDFWLITLPTIALAIVTVWANDRLARMFLTAVLALAPKKARRRKVNVAPTVNVEIQVHGKHEAPDGEEHHGFTFNALNRADEDVKADWDAALANITHGHTPHVWPEREHIDPGQ
jgi:hypothetical protein